MRYNNYHKHDHKGNVKSLDVVVKLEDYCKRAVELGHTTIFTTNHGIQGDIFEATTLAKQYGLKLIVGAECYYVNNRKEKDKSNKHIIVIALNNNGVKQLNKMLSTANVDGYYYKPRIDHELIMNLNPNDFVITTACVAGILKDEKLVSELFEKFKDNFLVEVQNHDDDLQREFNKLALEYNKKYGIKLIHANDSHYIKPEDSKYRKLFLKAKGIVYAEESEFILDYPDAKEIANRYIKQGVLNKEQIFEAINNTLIFDNAEEITIINDDIKLPSMSKNPNLELKKIISQAWNKERNNIPKERHKEYEDAIRYEMDIIERTHMEDYFILDYKMVKLGQEKYGGKLTNTGRGSAPSFYINKLLGLTDIDRLDSPIKLFPTRFMSAERILLAKSLPDIDLNTADSSPFIKATEDLLGSENCAWMIAWKPLQHSSAFRLYCKSLDLNINEYDEIAKNIDNYREDEKWKDIIQESEHFVGVIESISESPCSMLVYDKNVSEEIGLIKTTDKVCCLLDGYNCDKYKYLKNDILTVSVWSIIKEVCDMASISIPTIRELNNLLDDKTYGIYTKGLTCTINQADSDWATHLIKKYSPKSVSDVSAFVASIRPGFASLLDNFIERRHYTNGVKELDELLSDSYSYLLYQESIMSYLIWLGIEEKETYDIIKKIAKKKFKETELNELKNKLRLGWNKVVGREEGFEETWKVVEDASRYSFNASHSLSYAYDSLYGAYLKSHYPLEYYSVVLNQYSGDTERTNKLTDELLEFGITINPPKFRYSKAKYHPDRKTNSIFKGIGSIKYLNEQVGEELYKLRDNKYNNFVELLKELDSMSINSRQLEILIKLNFFDEFGKSKYLLDTVEVYNKLNGKKQFKKDNLPLGLTEDIIREYASKETEKMFTKIDTDKLITAIALNISNEDIPIRDIFKAELEYVGHISYIDKSYTDRVCAITEIKENKWGTVFCTLYRLNNGKSMTLKIDKKYFANKPLEKYDVINVGTIDEKFKRRKVDGKWVIAEDKEYILSSYGRVLNDRNSDQESYR